MKWLRRFSWYLSSYIIRYRYVIIGSITLSILCFLILKLLLSRLPNNKPKLYVGIVGNYTTQTIPPLVERILSSGLTRLDENQRILPELASSWQVLPGGKKYIFTLRNDLVWPSGKKLSSKDINIQISGVKIDYPDTNQISFETSDVFAPFPAILTHPTFNDKGQTTTGYTVSITQGTNSVIKDYFLKSPSQTVFIKVYPSVREATTAFKLGQVDHLVDLPSFPNIKRSDVINFQTDIDHHRVVALFFNIQDPILTDKSIRQAIAYYIEDKSFGFTRATGPIPPQSWAYNRFTKDYNFDPLKAQKLINDNLPSEKRGFALEISTLPDYLSIAENIKQQLSKQSIESVVRVVNSVPNNYQLLVADLAIPTDPDQYIYWHSTQNSNITHIKDPKIDKLLEDGRTTLDEKQRKQIYLEFQKVLMEELPAIFLYFPNKYHFSRGIIPFWYN